MNEMMFTAKRTPCHEQACHIAVSSGEEQKPAPVSVYIAALHDAADRGAAEGVRTYAAEAFLHQYQKDMLAIVEEMRALRRSRKEGSNLRPVPNYGSPRGLTRFPGAALKSAEARAAKEKQ
jgi:hypothetical protein